MARRRRKSKKKSEKQAQAKNQRFLWTLLAIFALFVIGYAVLRMSAG